MFCRAVLSIQRFWGYRLLPLHDWQSALVRVLLKSAVTEMIRLQEVNTVLTIHNIGLPGIVFLARFCRCWLPWICSVWNKLGTTGSNFSRRWKDADTSRP